MIGLLCFALAVLASPFKSKLRLEAENAALRHQLIVLVAQAAWPCSTRKQRSLVRVQLYRWFPSILQVLAIIRPETLIHWHRSGFRCYWRWKSRSLGGRPQIETGLRALIRQMSVENPLGARHASTANCSSLGLRPLNQASPSTWSNGEDRHAKGGGPFCVITRRILPLWTCSLSRLSVSTCSMPSSSSGSTAETWFGSTSQQIRQRSGLRVRSRRPSLGMMPQNTSSAIGITSMARSSHADCAPWTSGTSPLHQLHLGKMALPNGWSDRSGECLDHIIVLGEAHLRRILKF